MVHKPRILMNIIRSLAFSRGNVREVVGFSSDGSCDFQEEVRNDEGIICIAVGSTAEEAAQRAEAIAEAINRDIRDSD